MASREGDDSYMQYVDELRQKFSKVFQDNIQKNLYDKRDLDRLRLEDKYAWCFLRHQNGSVEKACDMIDVSLRWRRELGVNDLTERSFSQALHEAGGVFYHSHDKDGQQILHIVVAKNRKDVFQPLSVKQLLAWHIDKEFLKHPGKRIVVLIDMTGAGLSNVDIDLIKFQVACFTTYYPALLAYMLIFEMPWVLNAIWNIIKKLLTTEQQRHVLLVKKPQMLQYIDRDKLFVHMGGTDAYQYTYLPTSDSETEILLRRESDCESLMSSCELPANALSSASLLRKRVTFGGLPKSFTFDGCESSELEDQTSNCIFSDSSVYRGSLADISPSEQLAFHIEASQGDSVSHIRITNTSQHKLSFKVKTTSPDVYRVKPHVGFMAVKDLVTISVVLPNGHKFTDVKDKFLVMLLVVKDDISENSHDLLNSLWKNISRDSKDYMEYRLMCKKVHNSVSVTTKPAVRSPLAPSSTSVEDKLQLLLTKQQETEDQLKKITFLLIALIVIVLGLIFVLLTRF